MKSTIINMIKWGVNKSIDDSKNFRFSFAKWLGRNKQQTHSFVPFGTFGNPHEGTLALLLAVGAKESNIVALHGDPVNRIKKDCKAGEFGVGNPLTGANTYYKENGDITSETGNMTVTLTKDGKISISGASGEIISIIDEWMTTMISAKVVTGIGLMPLAPDTIISLTSTQLKLQQFKV